MIFIDIIDFVHKKSEYSCKHIESVQEGTSLQHLNAIFCFFVVCFKRKLYNFKSIKVSSLLSRLYSAG